MEETFNRIELTWSEENCDSLYSFKKSIIIKSIFFIFL